MKVLFIHGWLHTTDVYGEISSELNRLGFHCHSLIFDGLDNKSENGSVEQYIEVLCAKLRSNGYDAVVAHSMGCLILLECLEYVKDTPVILCNPVYENIRMWVKLFKPIVIAMLKVKDTLLPIIPGSKLLVKLLSLVTCNEYSCIDASVTEGVYKSNGLVCG